MGRSSPRPLRTAPPVYFVWASQGRDPKLVVVVEATVMEQNDSGEMLLQILLTPCDTWRKFPFMTCSMLAKQFLGADGLEDTQLWRIVPKAQNPETRQPLSVLGKLETQGSGHVLHQQRSRRRRAAAANAGPPPAPDRDAELERLMSGVASSTELSALLAPAGCSVDAGLMQAMLATAAPATIPIATAPASAVAPPAVALASDSSDSGCDPPGKPDDSAPSEDSDDLLCLEEHGKGKGTGKGKESGTDKGAASSSSAPNKKNK